MCQILSDPFPYDHNVMLRHPQTGALRFVRMLAALVGQRSTFFNFQRRSAFLEAVPRRLFWLLWTMYVDDGSLTDLAEAKGSGQEAIHVFFDEVGAGLKEAKREWTKQASQFLGVEHSFKVLMRNRVVEFWPGEGIEEELRAMIAADGAVPKGGDLYSGAGS